MWSADTNIIQLNLSGKNKDWSVLWLKTHTEINHDSHITVAFRSTDALDIENLSKENITLSVNDQIHYAGIILDANLTSYTAQSGFEYQLFIESPLALMKAERKSQTWTNLTPLDVLKKILIQYPSLNAGIQWKITRNFSSWPSIVQYNESDWHFFQRMVSRLGLSYLIEPHKNFRMIITDRANQLNNQAIETIHYNGAQGMAASDDAFQYHITKKQLPSSVRVRSDSTDYPSSFYAEEANLPANLASSGCLIIDNMHFQNQENAKLYAEQQLAALSQMRYQLHIVCANPDYTPGQIIRWAEDGKDYRILSSELKIDETIGQAIPGQDALRISNHLTLVPASLAIIIPFDTYPAPQHAFMRAEINAPSSKQNQIDTKGQYLAHYRMNKEESAETPSLALSQPFVGQNYGQHYPLYGGTEVLVAHNYGHLHQPWILGVLPNHENEPPLTQANRKQHIVRSFQGHEWLQDDSDAHVYQFKTANQNQWLQLSNPSDEGHIQLTNKKGTMHFTAGKQYQINSEHHLEQTAKGSHQSQIKNNVKLHTKGNIQYQSKQNISHLVKRDIHSTALKQSSHKSQGDMHYTSDDDQTWITQNGDIQLNIAGETNIQAGKGIAISGPITLQTGSAKVTISDSGINLEGSHITVIGALSGGSGSTETPSAIPAPKLKTKKQKKNKYAIIIEHINVRPEWRKQLPETSFNEFGTLLRLPSDLQGKIIQDIQAHYSPKTPEDAKTLKLPENFQNWTSLVKDQNLIQQAKLALQLNQAAPLNEGWLYVYVECTSGPSPKLYKKPHLYSEYQIKHHGESCVFSKVDLTTQAGLDKRESGGESDNIELPYQYLQHKKSLGKFKVYVIYSAIQLSWPRIHRYGGISKDEPYIENVSKDQKDQITKIQTQEIDAKLFKKRFGAPLPQNKLDQTYKAQKKKQKPTPEPMSGSYQNNVWQQTSLYFTSTEEIVPKLLLDDPLGIIQSGNQLTVNLFLSFKNVMSAMQNKTLKVKTNKGETEECFYHTAVLSLQLFLKYNYPDIVKQNGYYTSTESNEGKELGWAKAKSMLDQNKMLFCLNYHERELLHKLIQQTQIITSKLLLENWNIKSESLQTPLSQGKWSTDTTESIKDYFAQSKETFAKAYFAVYSLYSMSCEDSHTIDEKITINNQYINEIEDTQNNETVIRYKKVKRYAMLKTEVDSMFYNGGQAFKSSQPPKLIPLPMPAGYEFVKALHNPAFPLYLCLFPGASSDGEACYMEGEGYFNPKGIKSIWGEIDEELTSTDTTNVTDKSADAFRTILGHYAEHASEFNPTLNKIVEAGQIVEADKNVQSIYYKLLQSALQKDYRSVVKHFISAAKQTKGVTKYLNPKNIKDNIHSKFQDTKTQTVIENAVKGTGFITLALSIWDIKDEIVTATEQSKKAKSDWLILANITNTFVNMGGAIGGTQESLMTMLGEQPVGEWINESSLGKWCEKNTKSLFGEGLELTDAITRWSLVSDAFNFAGTALNLINDLTGIGMRDPARIVSDIFDTAGNGFFTAAAVSGLQESSKPVPMKNAKNTKPAESFDESENLPAESFNPGVDTTLETSALEASTEGGELAFGLVTAPEIFILAGIACIIISNIATLFEHNQYQDWTSGCIFNKNNKLFEDWQTDKYGQFRALAYLLIIPNFTLPKVDQDKNGKSLLSITLSTPSLYGLLNEGNANISFNNQFTLGFDHPNNSGVYPERDTTWENDININALSDTQASTAYPSRTCTYDYDAICNQIYQAQNSTFKHTITSLDFIPRAQLKLAEGIIPAQVSLPGEKPGWLSKHVHWLVDLFEGNSDNEDHGIEVKNGYWIGPTKVIYGKKA